MGSIVDPWTLWMGVFWLFILGAIFATVWLVRPRQNFDALAKSVGLPIIDEIRPRLESNQRRGVVALAVICGGGVLFAFAVLAATHATDVFEIGYGYVLVLAVAAGLGTMVQVVKAETRRQRADVRFARSRAITRTDYESRLWQWLPRITVALLVLGMIARALITPNPSRDIPIFVVIYTALTVVTLILSEVSARWIVGRGQPAGSQLELAWDDAYKSRSLNAIALMPAYLGANGGLIGATLAISGLVHIAINSSAHTLTFDPVAPSIRFILGYGAELLIGMPALLLLIVGLAVSLVTKSQQRYLRRLWPELVPLVPTHPALIAARESKQ